VTSPLTAATAPGPRPQRVTAVHLGLGAFHRAHQLWTTEAANRARLADGAAGADLDGYASFTGRRPGAAQVLQAQDGLFHLLVRHPNHDDAEQIRCLLDPHDGADVARLLDLVGSPDVSVITLTITEAGYRRRADGSLDTSNPDVSADISALRSGDECAVRTAPGRLLAAIRARAAVGLRPLALVSCDNLIDNGSTLATVVTDLADAVGDDNTALVRATSFVHSMVDRITPHTTDVERADISKLTGLADADPVACEPFTEWILAGEFPSGRPAWELGGARFTDDVKPFEQRKLWMLNATHSLLAYVGGLRGHETVDQAMGDEVCTALVRAWWDDAEAQIKLPSDETATYAQDLLDRYSNTSVQHRLAQIAGDGSQKLSIRIAPVLLATRAAGGRCTAGVTTLAAYVLHLRGSGVPVNDVAAEALQDAAAGDLTQAAGRVLALLDDRLTDGDLVADVAASAIGLDSSA
jgi:fructuronate reductase